MVTLLSPPAPSKVGIAMNDIACGVTALYGTLGASLPGRVTAPGNTSQTRCSARSAWEFGAYFVTVR